MLGLDLGYLLYALGVSAWFVMFTFPLGVIALLVLLVIWIIAALTRRLGRMDAPDTKA